MEILVKIFFTLWVLVFCLGLFLFYTPSEKAQRLSMILGLISFLVFPILWAVALLLSEIWRI